MVLAADSVDIHDAVRTVSCDGKFEEVQLALAVFPEKVNSKDVVRVLASIPVALITLLSSYSRFRRCFLI